MIARAGERGSRARSTKGMHGGCNVDTVLKVQAMLHTVVALPLVL